MNIKNILDKNNSNKCVYILANGPSVNDFDLSLLKNSDVIGMNGSSILSKQHNFQQKYYVLSDRRFLLNKEKKHLASRDMIGNNCFRILDSRLYDLDENEQKKTTYYVKSIGKNGFSTNLSIGYYFGCTTTMLAIQLAYFLNYTTIYLLGVDLNWTIAVKRFYSESRPQIPDEFRSIQIDNIVNANSVLNTFNIKLYSCSAVSLLRSYIPYKPFAESFSHNG